jgi:hypothetical protein
LEELWPGYITYTLVSISVLSLRGVVQHWRGCATAMYPTLAQKEPIGDHTGYPLKAGHCYTTMVSGF